MISRSTMFDLGSDDKKELQENMKEIKNLIDDEGKKKSQSKNRNQGVGQGNKRSQENNKSQGKAQEESSNTSLESLNNNNNNEGLGRNSTEKTQSGKSHETPPNQDNIINDDESSSKSSTPSNGEDSKNKEISHDEPLFLREEQFTDIREMVEEMSYLTQEMSQKIDRMKKTVRNERDISKDSEELVQAFTQRRSKIESTIKSGQN